MEVASTLGSPLPMYHAVSAALGRHALVMAHFARLSRGLFHLFTFTARAPSREASLALYDAIWRDGIAAVHSPAAPSPRHWPAQERFSQMSTARPW